MKLIPFIILSFFSTFVRAQSTFHAHVNGNINLFLRTSLQVEIPATRNWSFGLRLRSYRIGTASIKKNDGYSVISTGTRLVFFKGNTLEAFGRRYFNKGETGNIEGWFSQLKLGFGNYQNPLFSHESDLLTYQNYTKQSFNTFGGVLGGGYKTILYKGITLELYGGLRYYTPPTFVRAENFNPLNYNGDEELVRNSWFITRSFPIEIGWKIGFQF